MLVPGTAGLVSMRVKLAEKNPGEGVKVRVGAGGKDREDDAVADSDPDIDIGTLVRVADATFSEFKAGVVGGAIIHQAHDDFNFGRGDVAVADGRHGGGEGDTIGAGGGGGLFPGEVAAGIEVRDGFTDDEAGEGVFRAWSGVTRWVRKQSRAARGGDSLGS